MNAAQPAAVETALQRPGYIQPHALRELWFHTGTACNLRCPFCLEGSKPGDRRLGRITLDEIRPLIAAAVDLGVEQFSFTGGEPFVVKDFVNILEHAARLRPCLVLTNGTAPVLKRLHQIAHLAHAPQAVSFRVSIDYPDAQRHEQARGPGTYAQAWQAVTALHGLGFRVSLARQMTPNEDAAAVTAAFGTVLTTYGLPADLPIVAFPDFLIPNATSKVPFVSENCMTTFQTDESRRRFMCAFSKMIVKKGGRLRVYACTLVDDDETYDLGGTLAEAFGQRILLRHHRCYTCFAHGSSCSELDR
jgi:sulfatase maturation enzyme AslB (radical SAM superfamily)